MRPLAMGDSARFETGRIQGSDCVGRAYERFAWRTSDTAVVVVRPDGWVIARAPGTFHAAAAEDTTMLVARGFVLPAQWSVRLSPEVLAIHVGDTAQFDVRAVGPDGRVLPPVPYSIFTAEFFQPTDSGPRRPPPVDKWSHQEVTGLVAFIAQRPGHTEVRAQIGTRRVTGRLTVLHSDSLRRGTTSR